MLRRRHHAQTEAARKTERRKETHEGHWHGEHPAGGLYRSAQGMIPMTMIVRWFFSRTVRQATEMTRHVRRLLQAQRDILTVEAARETQHALAAMKSALRTNSNKS